MDRRLDGWAGSRKGGDVALKELSRQIGGLGNASGTFTERRRLADARRLEMDMLGWNDATDHRVVVGEI